MRIGANSGMRSERGVDWDGSFFCNAFMCYHVSALMLFTIFPLEFIVGLATSVGHPNQVFSTGQEFGRIYFHLFFFLPRREFFFTLHERLDAKMSAIWVLPLYMCVISLFSTIYFFPYREVGWTFIEG